MILVTLWQRLRRRSLGPIALAAVFTAVLFSCGSGKVTYDLTDAGQLAVSGDLTIPASVFQAMFDAMKKARLQESKDPRAALFKVVADHYLAKEFARLKKDVIDASLKAEIQKVYHETLAFFIREKNPEALFKGYTRSVTIPDIRTLKSLFDENAPAAYTNVPLKREAADKIILATYGKIEKKLTYTMLFDALPQAGKLHLFTSPNESSIKEMINVHLRGEFLNEYVASADEKAQKEFAALRQIVENSIYSRQLRYDMGMENANPHADNNALKEKAKSISLSRIKEYYEANKDKYKEVQTVDCRHIQLKDYDLANNLRDKIDQGANMVDLVRKHSLAKDKNDPDPGLIKGIVNDTTLHTKPRIHALCMLPKQGQAEVVKDSDVFEVVKAEKRTEGYPPLDDTTHLREDLARELAGIDLRQEFDEKKKKILKKVDIRINKAELEKIQ